MLVGRSPELVERWLQRRIKRMSEANRNQVEAQLSGSSDEGRVSLRFGCSVAGVGVNKYLLWKFVKGGYS